MSDTVTLVGVKADGTEHVLGKATMPPKMKARELVQTYFGQFDGGNDDDSDGAMAYWAACELIDWMEKQSGVKVELAQPAALQQQAVPEGWKLAVVSDGDIRVYGPDKETWLIRKDCGEGFDDCIYLFFEAMLAAAPAAHQASQGAAPAQGIDTTALRELADAALIAAMKDGRHPNAKNNEALGTARQDLFAAIGRLGAPQAPAVTPAAGETWHFLLKGASACSTALVEEVTSMTVQIQGRFGSPGVRYPLADVQFIERVSQPPVQPNGETEAAPQAEQQAGLSDEQIESLMPALPPFDHEVMSHNRRDEFFRGFDEESMRTYALSTARAALAAQQAEREPLTNAQIAAAWRAWPRTSITSAARAIEFARAIERAHGIGHHVPGQGRSQ